MSAIADRLLAVDELQIEVLVDNRTDGLSSAPSSVTSEFSRVLARRNAVLGGPCLCCAGHGLSLLVTATIGDHREQLLFDAGPDPELFERNVRVLETDLSRVTDVVLSHGHWDHAAGLPSALKLIADGGRVRPRVHMNPDMFKRRGVRIAERVLPFADIPGEASLSLAGGEPIISNEERLLCGNSFYLSTEIPRITSFETGFFGHVRWEESQQQWVDDALIMDERYLAVRIRDKGLMVFSACSHAGIVNVLADARKRFPGDRLFAVIGGLHLSGFAMEGKITQTIDAMAGFGLEVILPAHCTGWRAVNAIVERFGESSTIPCAVGQLLRF